MVGRIITQFYKGSKCALTVLTFSVEFSSAVVLWNPGRTPANLGRPTADQRTPVHWKTLLGPTAMTGSETAGVVAATAGMEAGVAAYPPCVGKVLAVSGMSFFPVRTSRRHGSPPCPPPANPLHCNRLVCWLALHFAPHASWGRPAAEAVVARLSDP